MGAQQQATPAIRTRNTRAPATGARFVPGRIGSGATYNPDKILFNGEPFYERAELPGGKTLAGVPFGPNMEPPGEANLKKDADRRILADGARIIRAGATPDSRVVKPEWIQMGDSGKRRQQISQYSVNRTDDGVVILPPEEGMFTWQIWTGFYDRNRLPEARILTQNGMFLHGAGPFQGAAGFDGVGRTTSTVGLLVAKESGLAQGLAQEVQYRLHVEDGIPLWQAYYFKAGYSAKDCQAVLVRQLHQCFLLFCTGGVPSVKTFPAETFKHSYNDQGIPIPGPRLETMLAGT